MWVGFLIVERQYSKLIQSVTLCLSILLSDRKEGIKTSYPLPHRTLYYLPRFHVIFNEIHFSR